MITAQDVMITDVYSVQEEDTIEDVMKTFANRGISGAPIVDRYNHLKGYISDGDIMRQLGRQDKARGYVGWAQVLSFYYGYAVPDSVNTTEIDELRLNFQTLLNKSVQSVGTKKTIVVKDQEPIVNVSELLARKNIKKVPVVHDNTLVGIISRGDIVRFVVKRFLDEHS
ncbi:CBS domain-containing protein [Alicyclobacillus acidoterrestris]|uniref:CBS domain-containing protein n=1 Tax=Alicyclobacillus acidoterrestris TaxID=1450 RepID=UPI003F531974